MQEEKLFVQISYQYPSQQQQAILAQFQNKSPKITTAKSHFKFLQEKFKREKK